MHSKDMILSCPMTINYTHTHTQRHICTDFMLLFIYVIVQCYYNMSSAACVSTIDWWLHQVCAFLCIYFSVVAIAIAFVSLSFLFTVFFSLLFLLFIFRACLYIHRDVTLWKKNNQWIAAVVNSQMNAIRFVTSIFQAIFFKSTLYG